MKKVLLILALALLSTQAKALDYDDDGVSPGYRGFVDFSYSLGVGDFGKNHDRVNLMTSHGYQFVPQFFAGIGIGANYYYDDEAWNLPIFAHFRSDILANDITPFVDLKVGYSFIDVKGFYLNPSVGCRFAVSDNLALNIGVGYTLQKTEFYYYGNENCGSVDFRFGIDF